MRNWMVGVLLVLCGCGSGSGGSVDASSSGDAALSSPCPASLPSGACSRAGLVCEYGDDPRESCRSRAECTGGTWQATVPRCATLPPVTCPATREAAAGELCTPMDAWCSYGDLDCECTNCRDFPVSGCAGDLRWKCEVPSTEPGCPAAKPALGSGCAPEGQVCRYECGAENGRTCSGGGWLASEGGPCPISMRSMKTSVHYLDEAEVAAMARAAEAIPLATWSYLDQSLGRGRRLGFIIDDLPGSSPAVETDRGMVNEYGYTSMLLAAVKAQRAEIEQLKQQLESLRKEVRKGGR